MQHDVTIEAQVDIPEVIDEESVTSLLTHVLLAEEVTDPWELGVQLLDDPTMQAAHIEFMGIDEPTDIMTFPYSDADDAWGPEQHGGDLMISVERARSNAHDADWQEEDEIFFLIVHGILHLLGWDDHDDSDRFKMLDRQQELLVSWPERPIRQ